MSTPTQERIKHEEQGALARQTYDVIHRRRKIACHREAYALIVSGFLDWQHVGPILGEFNIGLEPMPGFWRATCYGMFGEASDPCEAVLRAPINWDEQALL